VQFVGAINLTGSLLKNTNDALVRTNQRFFHDVHPIPIIADLICNILSQTSESNTAKIKQNMNIWH
jgi:hypothetical protein